MANQIPDRPRIESHATPSEGYGLDALKNWSRWPTPTAAHRHHGRRGPVAGTSVMRTESEGMGDGQLSPILKILTARLRILCASTKEKSRTEVNMRGGHNKIDAKEHELRGTFRPSRHGKVVISPAKTSEKPPTNPPEGLSPAAREIWTKYVTEWDGWSSASLAVLEVGLLARDRATACRQTIEREGLWQPNARGGPRIHPLARVERQATSLMLGALARLGLDQMTPRRRPVATPIADDLRVLPRPDPVASGALSVYSERPDA